jgi:DNA-binding protein HU-beta
MCGEVAASLEGQLVPVAKAARYTQSDFADDLIDFVGDDAGLSKRAARDEIGWFFETIADQLKKGTEVRISGFGVFRVLHRKARKVRNPMTGEEKMAPAKKVIRFRPAAVLNQSVTGKTSARATSKPAAKSTAKKATVAKAGVAKKATAKKATPAKKTTAKARR